MTAQPLILALETSTLSCSVALFRGEQLLGAKQISEAQHVHGKELLPLIDEVLRANEITSTELQGIAVSAGPGIILDCGSVFQPRRESRMPTPCR